MEFQVYSSRENLLPNDERAFFKNNIDMLDQYSLIIKSQVGETHTASVEKSVEKDQETNQSSQEQLLFKSDIRPSRQKDVSTVVVSQPISDL